MKTIKAKVIMLPTNDKLTRGSILLRHLWKDTKLECRSVWQYDETKQLSHTAVYTTLNGSFMDAPSSFKSQHIYLTTDEEIKENFKGYAIVTVKDDPRIKYVVNCICTERNQVYCLGDRKFSFEFYSVQKIVATTDTSLWEHDDTVPYPKTRPALPQIPQEFLKEYCETDGKIEEVEIEYTECKMCGDTKKHIVSMFGEVDCNYCEKRKGYEKLYKEPILKLDSNNCVIISKSKDSWSREEVVLELRTMHIDLYGAGEYDLSRVEDWIKENL